MYGVWNQGPSVENVDQPHSRHKCIIVNTGALAAGGVPPNAYEISANAQDAMPSPASGTFNNRAQGFEGGPHFIMSPTTPDGRPTLGFEFGLFSTPAFPVANAAVAGAGGFTITPWVLVDVLQGPGGGLQVSTWMAMAPVTGVGYNQLFSSFDINSSAIRFQIGNIAAPGSVGLCFCEL